jgi:hypothetical protein
MSLLANCPGRGRAGGADSAPGSAYTTTPPLSVRFGWMQPSRVMKAAVTVFKDRPMSAHKRTVDSVGRTTGVVIGLGLFDVCPIRGEGRRRAGAGGQTLNKPRRRKPRNAAAQFGEGTAYGDLMPVRADEIVIVRAPGSPTCWKSARA